MSTDPTEEQSSAPTSNLFGRKSTPKLAAALAKFQGAVGVIHKDKKARIDPKDSTKRGFEYKYADLASIAEAAYPLLAENGLSFTASPTMGERGFVLEYTLMHESGEARHGTWPLPNPLQVDIKQIGIAITYARRYCFSAVTGIVTEEDADTQGAPAPQQEQVGRPRPQGRERAQARKAVDDEYPGPTDKQRKMLHAQINELEISRDEGLALMTDWVGREITTTNELSVAEASTVIDHLKVMLDAELRVNADTGEVQS